MSGPADELERLADLYTKGILTEDQFQMAKSRLLESGSSPSSGTAAATSAGPTPTDDSSRCPACGQSDHVEKLSRILRVKTQYSDVTPFVAGSATRAPDWRPWDLDNDFSSTAIVGFSECPPSEMDTNLLPPVAPPDTGAAKHSNQMLAKGIGAAVTGTVLVFTGPLGGFAAGKINRSIRKKMDSRQTVSSIPIDNPEWVQWQVAAQRWDSLLYCKTCNGVFLPNGFSPCIHAGMTQNFLLSEKTAGPEVEPLAVQPQG